MGKRYWIAEHSQHNCTLTCYYSRSRFANPTYVQGLQWYYEFVNDCLHIKVISDSADLNDVYNWIKDAKSVISGITVLPLLHLKPTKIKSGRWMTV
jgi:hypothetical protein